MIRFSAFLVVVAVGLLVAGVVTSKLLLVYLAIGVSGVALLALGVGAAVNWRELTGKPRTDAAEASAQEPAPAPQVAAAAGVAAAGPGWPAAVPSGPSLAGYLPAAEPPLRPAAFTPRTEAPARGAWGWRDEAAAEDKPRAEDKPSDQDQDQPPTDRQDGAQPEALASEPEPPPAAADTPATSSADQAEQAGQAGEAEQTEEAEQGEGTAQAEQAKEAEPADPDLDPDLEVTVVPGVPRYHKARCILIRFMGDSDLDTITLAAARESGCTPCRACLPD